MTTRGSVFRCRQGVSFQLPLTHSQWGAGVATGACLSILLALRELVPGYIENWRDGGWGEQWTAQALSPLVAEGWTVLHDRGAGKGNLDHVLVGPAGVFLLDSKRWHGRTTIEGGVPTLRRHEDADLPASRFETLPGRQRASAARVRDVLKAETGVTQWVQPVVVIWGEFPEQILERDGVAYLHGDAVLPWLRERRVRLSSDHVGRLAAGLSGALKAA